MVDTRLIGQNSLFHQTISYAHFSSHHTIPPCGNTTVVCSLHFNSEVCGVLRMQSPITNSPSFSLVYWTTSSVSGLSPPRLKALSLMWNISPGVRSTRVPLVSLPGNLCSDCMAEVVVVGRGMEEGGERRRGECRGSERSWGDEQKRIQNWVRKRRR